MAVEDPMRVRGLMLLSLLFTIAPAVQAEEHGYTFRVSLATVADGMRAVDVTLPALQTTPLDRLQQPAIVFEKRSGGRGWRATFASCADAQTPFSCEIRINQSSQRPEIRDCVLDPLERQLFDLAFSRNRDGTLHGRCLKKSCSMRIISPSGSKSQLELKFGESWDLPSGSEIEALFVD